MADKTTIARPYARAAFSDARSSGRLAPWSEALRAGSAAVQDERVQNLLGNPHVTPQQLAQLIIDVAGGQLDEHGRNFVQTIAENRRLARLPEISKMFDELKDAEEGVVDVTVTSAAPLGEAQQRTLAEALCQKTEARSAPALRDGCGTDRRRGDPRRRPGHRRQPAIASRTHRV